MTPWIVTPWLRALLVLIGLGLVADIVWRSRWTINLRHRHKAFILCWVIGLVAFLWFISKSPAQSVPIPIIAPKDQVNPQVPSGAIVATYRVAKNGALLPDKEVTPGLVLTSDPAVICQNGYATQHREANTSEYRQAHRIEFDEYKDDYRKRFGHPPQHSDGEDDHLISIEDGGDPTAPENRWFQPYLPAPGAHEKDEVENEIHRIVCSEPDKDKAQKMLIRFQQQLADDWTQVFPASGI